MRFTLTTEQRQFATSLHDALGGADVPSAIRAWRNGSHEPGRELWRKLAGLGVTALAVPERHDGMGAEPVDMAVAMEAVGYHAVPGPLVETTALLPELLGGLADQSLATRWLPGIAAGDTIASCVLPPHVPYALDADFADVVLTIDDDQLGRVPTVTGDPLGSVDPARRLFDTRGMPAQPEASGPDVAAAARRAFDFGVLATAAQLLGCGQRLLDTSVEYARQRSQYGREIGSYQAIKHMLADVAAQLELARPLVHGAAVALADGAASVNSAASAADQGGTTDTTARDTSAARVACADASYLAARTGLQVHGAIGYTDEHDLGMYLRKVRALVSAWGTQRYHRDRVMRALRA